MIFVDSSFILALFNRNDVVNNRKAELLLKAIPEFDVIPKAINNVVLNEVLNNLKKSYYAGKREEIIDYLFSMDEIYFVDEEAYSRALFLYRKYNYEVNFSDFLIVLSMRDHGISDILSFDSDFSRIKNINNICI